MNRTLEGRTVFVTGSTGLLGNNLVRALVAHGVKVKALARSLKKAELQFAGLKGVEVVQGDMTAVADFAGHLRGCEVLFHIAAYFRDSYTGGDHSAALRAVNIDGTRALVENLRSKKSDVAEIVVPGEEHEKPLNSTFCAQLTFLASHGGARQSATCTAS